jgi:KaiC/GvpD/RAD55 family RecA-like ATPase
MVIFTVQDFTVSSTPSSATISSGGQASWSISLASVNGFTGQVNLAAVTSTSGLSCALTPDSVSLGASAVSTLSCTGSSAGTYDVTITATGGPITRTTTIPIIVLAPAQSISLVYFILAALAIATGTSTGMILRRFNTTSAPFDELFKLTGGELQQPTTLMIIGDSGSGTTTLALQLIHRQLSAGRSCGLLTYDSFPSEIQRRTKGLGWDIAPYLDNQTLKIVDCYSALVGDERAAVKDPMDFTEVSIRVSEIVQGAPKGPVTILLDSVTPIFNSVNSKNAINFLRVIGAKVKNSGGIFIFTGTKGSISDEVRSNLEAMADGVIELGLVRAGESVKKILTVKKIAGHNTSPKPSEFEIVTHRGILFKRRRIKLLKLAPRSYE